MKIIDISLEIRPGMPVWPGQDEVLLERHQKIEDGANANVTYFASSAHTGTHVDAPFHFLPDGKTVEKIPIDVLVGAAQVVQIPSNIHIINEEVIEDLKLEPVIERVLFKTTNSEIWKRPNEPFHQHYVALDESGAKALVERGIKLIGIDYLSVSPFKKSQPTHTVLLGADVVILEGLNLSEVHEGKYMLYCLPLKLVGADGAPARAVLLEG